MGSEQADADAAAARASRADHCNHHQPILGCASENRTDPCLCQQFSRCSLVALIRRDCDLRGHLSLRLDNQWRTGTFFLSFFLCVRWSHALVSLSVLRLKTALKCCRYVSLFRISLLFCFVFSSSQVAGRHLSDANAESITSVVVSRGPDWLEDNVVITGHKDVSWRFGVCSAAYCLL